MIVAKPPDNQRSVLCAQNVGLTVCTKCRTVCRTTPYCQGARPGKRLTGKKLAVQPCNTTTRPTQASTASAYTRNTNTKRNIQLRLPNSLTLTDQVRDSFSDSLFYSPRCVESRLWHAKTRRTERTRMWDRGGLVCYIALLTHARKRNYLFVDGFFFESAHSSEPTENQTPRPLQLSQSESVKP